MNRTGPSLPQSITAVFTSYNVSKRLRLHLPFQSQRHITRAFTFQTKGTRGGSLFPPDHLFQVELTLCCHDRQLVLQVVCDEVAYALEQHVFGSDLQGGQREAEKEVASATEPLCFLLAARLTTPSGSTSSRCLGSPQCMPVSTYCPGLVVLSRTRKSPSRTRSFSASRLLMRLWYHVSLRS